MEGNDEPENEARMARGDLYFAWTPNILAKRKRGQVACDNFSQSKGSDGFRRKLVELWKEIVDDRSPLPPPAATEEDDYLLLLDEPHVDSPIKLDYGTNLVLGKGVQINCNCTFIDTCLITIGARTLVAPNRSFFSGTHPLDPFLRNGINGPEAGAPITIGEDCWIGGNAIICPGVTIGRGVVVGAGSVVTKDVSGFHVVAGNPAKAIRKIEPQATDPIIAKCENEMDIRE